MSWLDNIENTVFTIKTGDGKEYTPDLPINYETLKEFNAATFEFIDKPGALITRKLVRARKFPLTFFFQGEDNIATANDFDQSANDPRAWVVRHPQYGDITGQPISIRRDDSKLNATEITVDFWETITTTNPVSSIAPADAVASRFTEFNTISPEDYASKVNLKAADKTLISLNLNSINNLINKILTGNVYEFYQSVINVAFSSLDSIITNPVTAIRDIQQVIIQPALFDLAVLDRLNLIVSIYNNIDSLLGIDYVKNNKAYFEAAAGAAIASLATAVVNPLTVDYATRDDVVKAANILVDKYNDYLAQLDAAYVQIGDPLNSFTASNQTQNIIQNMVFQAIDGLNTIAFNAKVERIVMLNKDSQLIVLVHKYMGLDADDANIETFRTINNLKNNYLFLVPKGTQIKYYA